MKISEKFYTWRWVLLQGSAVTIDNDIFSPGNIILLKISFPMEYNMFSSFIDNILSQSHELLWDPIYC